MFIDQLCCIIVAVQKIMTIISSLVKPKTMKLVFAAALPCTQHLEVKAKQKQKSSEYEYVE
jgi:hypothetical protein